MHSVYRQVLCSDGKLDPRVHTTIMQLQLSPKVDVQQTGPQPQHPS